MYFRVGDLLLYEYIPRRRLWGAGLLDSLYLLNIPLKLLMAHGECVKQLLHTDRRPSGSWVGGSLDNSPIVIKHQPSPDLRGRVAGGNSHVAGRESRRHGVRNSQVLITCSFSYFRSLKPLLEKMLIPLRSSKKGSTSEESS